MLTITDDNYEDYKQIFEILWTFIAKNDGLDPNGEYSPIIVLLNWERKSKSMAKRGLRAGLIDLMTMSMDLSIDMKKEINDQLIINGLSGFNQLVLTVKDTLQKVLKRGKIRNLDEFYLLKELLDDSTSEISEADKRHIEKVIGDFENNYSKKKNG